MQIVKLFYTLKYLRLSQIISRVKLTLKRKIREKNASHYNRKYRNSDVNPVIKKKLPDPVFFKKNNFFVSTDRGKKTFNLQFLNETYHFQKPINWHKKELEHGTRLWKLHLHYMQYLEEVDDDWFIYLINSWIDLNEPFKEKYWLDSWNSFALSIRVVVWMQQIGERKGKLSRSFLKKINTSIYKQLLFLSQNIEYDIRGNHLVKNIKALLWASYYFEADKNVKNWRKIGLLLLQKELDEQILADGMHVERSPAYHCQVLADILEIYTLLENKKLKTQVRKKLFKMGRALEMITHPNGKISLFNDGELSMPIQPKTLLNALEDLTGYILQEPIQTRLPEAGYWGLRKNNSFLLYDAGKIGPDYLLAHAHGDIFSFEWTVNGKHFFIDKGVYEYAEGKKRRESRATSSHNTVTIADKDQCEFWGAFRVARRPTVSIANCNLTNNCLSIEAVHNGYKRLKGKPMHKRKIFFEGNKLTIEDFTQNGENQEAVAHFLLHPEVKVFKIKQGCLLQIGEEKLKLITKLPWKLLQSRWFPNFGQELACTKIEIRYGKAPCSGKIEIEKV